MKPGNRLSPRASALGDCKVPIPPDAVASGEMRGGER